MAEPRHRRSNGPCTSPKAGQPAQRQRQPASARATPAGPQRASRRKRLVERASSCVQRAARRVQVTRITGTHVTHPPSASCTDNGVEGGRARQGAVVRPRSGLVINRVACVASPLIRAAGRAYGGLRPTVRGGRLARSKPAKARWPRACPRGKRRAPSHRRGGSIKRPWPRTNRAKRREFPF